MGGGKEDKGCGGGESTLYTHGNMKTECTVVYNQCMLIL